MYSDFYKANFGTTMGSPVSVLMANLYVVDFETRAITTFGDGIKFWVRYVDDVFCLVKKDRVASLLDHLNRQSPSISFTVEQEENNTQPVLDIKITKCSNGRLRTTV